jgi:uncharacterized ferritin-like protein (DUF455 family)
MVCGGLLTQLKVRTNATDLCNSELINTACAYIDSLLERLLCVNLIHEARGLDTFPLTMAKFLKAGDQACQSILDNNFNEELTHVRAGVKWFCYLCTRSGLDPCSVFHDRFPKYFKGGLKDTNVEARISAGMPLEWFSPFVQNKK